jgi:glutamine synthetase
LLSAERKNAEEFISELAEELPKFFPLIYKVEKEQGATQIEIKTAFTSDLSRLCKELNSAKIFIKNFAAERNATASFDAQPVINDCGNALQFNISLHDCDDRNLFESDRNLLTKSAAGLLEMTNAMMIFLAPKSEDYLRFSYDLNRKLFKKGKFTAPVNLSFGADNRTCAIRIPTTLQGKFAERLEYRPAAADADPHLCVAAILLAIFCGVSGKLFSPEQIHGNAFDEQYQLKNFCESLEEAEEIFFREDNFIRKWLRAIVSKNIFPSC